MESVSLKGTLGTPACSYLCVQDALRLAAPSTTCSYHDMLACLHCRRVLEQKTTTNSCGKHETKICTFISETPHDRIGMNKEYGQSLCAAEAKKGHE